MEKAMIEDESSSIFSELELNWFGELTSSLRLSQLYTIMIGLNKNFKRRMHNDSASENTQTSNFNPATEKKTEEINM